MASIADDVDDFIQDNRLDDEARDALYDLDASQQREVLDRGPLHDARNPSAVVLSRVRQLKKMEAAGGKNEGVGNMEDEIANFVEEYDLDERAETVLKETEDCVLQELFTRGHLTDARNPSAVVLARIREIRKEMEHSGGRGNQNNKHIDREVARFVRDNDLDERAEQCLKESETWVLKELLSRGSLHDARNPSAVVLSRLREIKRDGPGGPRDDRDRDRGKTERLDDRRRGDAKESKGKGKGKAEFMEFAWEMWESWNRKGGRSDRDHRDRDNHMGKGRAPVGRGPY